MQFDEMGNTAGKVIFLLPGTACDYLVVGSKNLIASEYATVTDEGGFLVSRRKEE